MSNDVGESLFDGDIRVDKIIWLAGISASINYDFEDLIEEEGVDGISRIVGIEPSKVSDDDELDEDDREEIDADELVVSLSWKGKDGFIVQCSTPVVIVIDESGTFTCSWGYYTSKWFYTEKLDAEFVNKTVKPWKDELFNSAVSKFKAKKGGSNE